MSHSFRTPQEEWDGTQSAPCSPPGPALRTRGDFYECNVCQRGNSTKVLLKGCKRKRPSQKMADNAKYDMENELFLHKCSKLQCYLAPLSSILRGLRSGRYSGRLSGFQESLAMDRIQRILGILQSPCSGGRFLSTVLKIEQMLQSWFPHVRDSSVCKRQKLCPVAPEWLHCSHDAPLPWPCAAPSATQDNAVSSSTDVHTAPPRDSWTASFALRSPCLERLLRAKDSIIQTRTESRPDANPD